jgi:hypothetical protein
MSYCVSCAFVGPSILHCISANKSYRIITQVFWWWVAAILVLNTWSTCFLEVVTCHCFYIGSSPLHLSLRGKHAICSQYETTVLISTYSTLYKRCMNSCLQVSFCEHLQLRWTIGQSTILRLAQISRQRELPFGSWGYGNVYDGMGMNSMVWEWVRWYRNECDGMGMSPMVSKWVWWYGNESDDIKMSVMVWV